MWVQGSGVRIYSQIIINSESLYLRSSGGQRTLTRRVLSIQLKHHGACHCTKSTFLILIFTTRQFTATLSTYLSPRRHALWSVRPPQVPMKSQCHSHRLARQPVVRLLSCPLAKKMGRGIHDANGRTLGCRLTMPCAGPVARKVRHHRAEGTSCLRDYGENSRPGD